MANNERERVVKRLKEDLLFAHETAKKHGGTADRSMFSVSDLCLLLSERTELLATVERMRQALWPFAQVKPTANSGFVNICALNADVIAARAALTTGEYK